ncbi:MAG TPA: ATP-binding protein [Candidatus Acidoferrales bacterium]|jgi:signal transduction histidine kinase/ActR/RegA family two-component response regulator|nr:ATP-binding protein [Candidatus Acidoferrales bacterium]
MLRNLPIRRKLMAVNLLISGVVLVLACAAFITYEVVTLRKGMVQGYTTRASIIAANSSAALAFANEADATDVLSALKTDPRIVKACIYDKDGHVFAKYPANAADDSFPKSPAGEGYHYEPSYLSVYYPVIQNDRTLGIVYVQSDLTALTDRYYAYGWLSALIMAGSIIIASILSVLLRKQIARPILTLAETAGAITQKSDFSLRATKYGNDELGLLTDAFNKLLGSIEERDKALRGEIVERKGAEDKAQAQLARLELLHRITRATGERQDLQSIFQVVIRTLEEQLPVDFCCICLYDQATNSLTVTGVGVRSQALAMELALTKQSHVEIDQNGLSRCVNGHLVYEPDVQKINFRFPQRLARGGLRALVASPLLVESQVFGVLISARRAADSFSSGECEFLRQLSEHVALAAHQAQLYEALQKAYNDLRQTQQAVMQQERLKALGQMASGIAHDINNAISPVALYTESLLEKEPQLSPRARDYLTTIQRAIDDVAQTVARMREFYRQREPQLMSRPVQLNPLIQQVMDLSRARWSDMPQQRGVFIKPATDLAPELPAIMGMESEIREALVNLVFNAVDAMPEGGTLTLRTKAPASAGQPVLVEVSDTGVGMDEDTRRRCLEPFFTTKGERGTGLGLAMVYGMVRRHGAEIEIESAPGKGTTMRLSFTVPATQPAADSKVGPTPTVLLRQRILVVDDDPLLIKSLRDTLETDGHQIVAAGAGQEGIDVFRKAHEGGEPFAVVITDLGMPYVDGRQVASEVKRISPTTPVIMLTGWGQRLVAEDDVPPHVDQVLNKPPKLRDLREALAKCLQPKKT